MLINCNFNFLKHFHSSITYDLQVLFRMLQRLKCPLVTADSGAVISLERTEKPDALAIVWMSIDSPQFPISGYLVFLNDKQCGARVRMLLYFVL